MKKDNVELARALQAAMNQLAGSGELGRMFAKGRLGWRGV